MSIILQIYSLIFLAIYVPTLVLVFCKKSWGGIPMWLLKHCTLDDIRRTRQVQKKLDGGDMNNNDVDHIDKNYLCIEYIEQQKYQTTFETSTDLLCCGMQSILQDDLTRPFKLHRSVTEYFYIPEDVDWSLFLLSVGFRWLILFPVRVTIMITAMTFLLVSSIVCILFNAKPKHSRYCGITFAKLYNIATGLVVNSHDTENRPKWPGLAVANHLSASDVMTMYADCQFSEVGYAVTAQTHGGFVNLLLKYGGLLTPMLLLNRESDTSRLGLRDMIVAHSKKVDSYPVLLFPEGYCTNNKVVLQFRKAVFDGHATIYPIALKQHTTFGDSFWAEDTFVPYLIRMMTSTCSVIDIYYLPPMNIMKDESEASFSKRVQVEIASKIGVPALPFDGKLKSKKEQLRYREKLQKCIAEQLLD